VEETRGSGEKYLPYDHGPDWCLEIKTVFWHVIDNLQQLIINNRVIVFYVRNQ
jgi:hypothetical protein